MSEVDPRDPRDPRSSGPEALIKQSLLARRPRNLMEPHGTSQSPTRRSLQQSSVTRSRERERGSQVVFILEFTRKNHVFCLKTLNEDSISKANTQRNHTEAHVKGTGTGYCLSETGSLVCRNTALLKQTLQLVDECCLLLLERLLSFRTDIYVGQN